MTVGAWPIARMLGPPGRRAGAGTSPASSDAMARSRALARVPLLGRVHAPAGAALNVLLPPRIVLLSGGAIGNGSHPRLAGQALRPPDAIISLGVSAVFPP